MQIYRLSNCTIIWWGSKRLLVRIDEGHLSS